MDNARRGFFKKTGALGALVATTGTGTLATGPAHAAEAGSYGRLAAPAMVKGMTLLTLKSGERYSLGVKTANGILDVARAD